MIAASALLVVIGTSDLLHSRSLTVPDNPQPGVLPPVGWRRWVLAIVAAAMVACVVFATPWWAGLGFVLGSAIWMFTYIPRHQTLAFVVVALVVIGLTIPAVLLHVPTWRWTLTLPSSPFLMVVQWVLGLVAVTLVNITTANRVVRAVLRFTNDHNTPAHSSSSPTRAGRVIGVLERFLLIVLVVAGQGISIAGLAAAKSIIRFPEISATAKGGHGLSAETFFVGTLTSWLFALASAAVLALSIA